MTTKQNFISDVEQERILTPILSQILFTDYFDKKYHSVSELIEFDKDKNSQFAGKDVVVHERSGRSINIDIKCQTNKYINHPTNTFSLEVDYLKNGDHRRGWLLNSKMQTDYYAFAWIHRADVCEKITDISQLHDVEFMLVKKSDINEYLTNLGCTGRKLLELAEALRSSENADSWIDTKDSTKAIHVVCSRHLNEKPVNLVVSKASYMRMPHTLCYRYIDGVLKDTSTRKTVA